MKPDADGLLIPDPGAVAQPTDGRRTPPSRIRSRTCSTRSFPRSRCSTPTRARGGRRRRCCSRSGCSTSRARARRTCPPACSRCRLRCRAGQDLAHQGRHRGDRQVRQGHRHIPGRRPTTTTTSTVSTTPTTFPDLGGVLPPPTSGPWQFVGASAVRAPVLLAPPIPTIDITIPRPASRGIGRRTRVVDDGREVPPFGGRRTAGAFDGVLRCLGIALDHVARGVDHRGRKLVEPAPHRMRLVGFVGARSGSRVSRSCSSNSDRCCNSVISAAARELSRHRRPRRGRGRQPAGPRERRRGRPRRS